MQGLSKRAVTGQPGSQAVAGPLQIVKPREGPFLSLVQDQLRFAPSGKVGSQPAFLLPSYLLFCICSQFVPSPSPACRKVRCSVP